MLEVRIRMGATRSKKAKGLPGLQVAPVDHAAEGGQCKKERGAHAMNELIKIHGDADERFPIDARELHGFLGSKQDFSTWVKAKVINNPYFEEGQDYVLLHNSVERTTTGVSAGGHNRIDYALAVDTAKKVSMAEQTKRGEEARDYFIRCEERLKELATQPQIPRTYAETLRLAADQAEHIEALETQKRIDAPRVEFAKTVEGTTEKISIGAYAKVTGKIGRNTLFKRMRESGILMASNIPYQRYMDLGYFEVSEIVIKRTSRDMLKTTTYLTGKGQVWLAKKIDEWVAEFTPECV